MLALLIVLTAPAATNVVTTLDDSGTNSLRQLIATANRGDTLVFGVAGTITLFNGQLLLDKDLIIQGPGVTNLALAGYSSRILTVNTGATVLISRLLLRDGRALSGASGTWDDWTATPGEPGESGGAIHNSGFLTLHDCRITSSRAGNGGNGVGGDIGMSVSAAGAGGLGGGVFNVGTLVMSNCVVDHNSAGNGGTSGSATWSPVSGAGGSGGGIYSTGRLRLEHCSLSSNAAGYGGNTPRESRGAHGGAGGGIWSQGELTAIYSDLTGNRTGRGGNGGADSLDGGSGGGGGAGGGVCGFGFTALTNCTLSFNGCDAGGDGGYGQFNGGGGGDGGSGGGIRSVGNLAVVACLLRGNMAGQGGGGGSASFYGAGGGGRGGAGGGLQIEGDALLLNSTLTENAGGNAGLAGQPGSSFPDPPTDTLGLGGGGGGVACRAAASNHVLIVNCTVLGNRAGVGWGNLAHGGGMHNESSAAVQCLNALVAGNAGASPDVFGTFTSLGHNLIGATNDSSGFHAPGDLVGSRTAPVDPRVRPLADHGGPTLTMDLQPDSPALEAGGITGAPSTDQRGSGRPQGHAPDIGAVEHQYDMPMISQAGWSSPFVFQLWMCGLPGSRYTVQVSSNLLDWSGLAVVEADDHGAITYADANPSSPTLRAYRLKQPAEQPVAHSTD